MNFEELYAKYKEGNVTDEEKSYVESEIEKAKAISDLIFDGNERIEYKDASKEEIKRVKHVFRIKTLIAALLVTAISVVTIVGVTLGVIFGISVPAAKKSINYTQEQAETLAIEYAVTNYQMVEEDITIHDSDRDINLQSPLKNSRYVYEIELRDATGVELEVIVDGKTGIVEFEEIDYRD